MKALFSDQWRVHLHSDLEHSVRLPSKWAVKPPLWLLLRDTECQGNRAQQLLLLYSRREHPQSTLRESGDALEIHYDMKLKSHIGNQVEIKP